MYLGTKVIQEKRWATRWVPGVFGGRGREESYCLGVVPAVRHEYRCDHCGYTALVIEKAEEPFFCWKCPNRLISLEQEKTV